MAFPTSAKYVIIAAGIHGLSTAWHLVGELKTRNAGSGKDKIAETAELSRATLYLYFKTKDEVFVQAIVRQSEFFAGIFPGVFPSGVKKRDLFCFLSSAQGSLPPQETAGHRLLSVRGRPLRDPGTGLR